jgi:pyruvate,water dikinase
MTTTAEIPVATCDEQFNVTWGDPENAKLSWQWDKMHQPLPIPALVADMRLDENIFDNTRTVTLNGYEYAANRTLPGPTPEVIERGAHAVWEDDYRHRVRTYCDGLRSADYDSMSAAELVDKLPSIAAEAGRTFRYTMYVVFGFMGPTMQLVGFAEKELGEDGDQLVARLLQGYDNRSAAAGSGLEELAHAASKSTAVASAIKEGRFSDIESVEGGSAFMAKFRDFLKEFGWRAESWSLVHFPTWAEDQSVPLTLIGQYLRDGTASPAAAIERAVAQREEARREVEKRLSSEKLGEFDAMLDVCGKHVSISESRAQMQLTISGSLRVPALALGKKLVDAGSLDEPNDLFFLYLSELKDAAANGTPMQSKVVERKKDLERWTALTPPPFVGAPPSEPPAEFAPIMSKFFGLGAPVSTEKNVVKGNPANAGVVRARARVIRELSESDRLQQGDVLVCPSTAPPWTPLFAIASAVVTDTGGILSHSAICAREYGLPCVVGTQTATQQIPDGAMIMVDGAKGTVTIEG